MNARRTTLPAPPNRVLSYRFVLPVDTIDVPSGYRRVWVFRISNRPMKSLGRWIASLTPIGTGTVDGSVAAPMYDTYIRRHPTPYQGGWLSRTATIRVPNRFTHGTFRPVGRTVSPVRSVASLPLDESMG